MPGSRQVALQCTGVMKSYGARQVLSGIDLSLPADSLTAVIGASGSGKTTLLRLIMGFESLDEGTVIVGGSVVSSAAIGAKSVHLAPEKRRIGYVPQEGALFPHLSVAENIGFGLPRRERHRSGRVAEVAEIVGLGADHLDRPPGQLSGGEQRRVALARALAPRPAIVLLDEPFSGLDAGLRAETRAALLTALAREHATALLVTHDQAEALSMGDLVAVLRDGALAQIDDPVSLYRRPVDLDVARFVGEAVVMPGRMRFGDRVVTCALGRLPVAVPGVGNDASSGETAGGETAGGREDGGGEDGGAGGASGSDTGVAGGAGGSLPEAAQPGSGGIEGEQRVLVMIRPEQILVRRARTSSSTGGSQPSSEQVASGRDPSYGERSVVQPGEVERSVVVTRTDAEPDGTEQGAGEPGEAAGVGSWVPARVIGVTYYGPDVTVALGLSAPSDIDQDALGTAIPVIARQAGHPAPTIGDEVLAAVSGEVLVYPGSSPQSLGG